jgi:hypothetical protein
MQISECDLINEMDNMSPVEKCLRQLEILKARKLNSRGDSMQLNKIISEKLILILNFIMEGENINEESIKDCLH